MISGIGRLITGKHGESGNTYLLQRMQHHGGWVTVKRYENEGSPPDLPEDPPAGRYRLVERRPQEKREVYGETVWTHETPDADTHYQEKREEHQQREFLEEVEEISELDRAWSDGDLQQIPLETILKRRNEILEKTEKERRESMDWTERLLEDIATGQEDLSEVDPDALDAANQLVESVVELENARGGR